MTYFFNPFIYIPLPLPCSSIEHFCTTKSVTDLRTDKYCIGESYADWIQPMKDCVIAIGCLVKCK